MQIFIIGSPFETAQALDNRRLNKQIIETRQIIKAIKCESNAWANHPCVKMYREHVLWLRFYIMCLCAYRNGFHDLSKSASDLAYNRKPDFHTQAYFDQMKRRLYTKDHEHYKQWSVYGDSDVNWYYVDGEWLYYRDGKRLKNVE